MSLFDDLSSLLEWTEWDSASDLGLDEVAPPDSDVSIPPSPQLAPSAGLSSLGGSTAPTKEKKRGNSVGAQMLALSMFDEQSPVPDFDAIQLRTGVSKSSVYKLRTKAISRGWMLGDIVEPEHVDDAPRLGRPKTSTATALFIIETMTKNSTTRGWSCACIAAEVTRTPGRQLVSPSTVYRVLTENGYGVFKRTVKPGLTEEAKKARLAFCLEHKDWTIEDWKNVIFLDETSVVLGGVRGNRRCWRKKEERYHVHCTVRRWKGRKEFMWWSCFSWDAKGLYHIWEKETAADKKAMEADLKARNAARYESDKA
jgi:Transposase